MIKCSYLLCILIPWVKEEIKKIYQISDGKNVCDPTMFGHEGLCGLVQASGLVLEAYCQVSLLVVSLRIKGVCSGITKT